MRGYRSLNAPRHLHTIYEEEEICNCKHTVIVIDDEPENDYKAQKLICCLACLGATICVSIIAVIEFIRC